MKLHDCVLEITKVISHPLVIERPEDDWVAARDRGIIPKALFRFYCCADYFSLSCAPRFLTDDDRILFSFLAGLTRGIRDSFDEAADLLGRIHAHQDHEYSPLKKLQGQDWDAKASIQKLRCFKYLIVNLSGALDQFAEIVSLFFYGDIEGLTVGRASFKTLNGLLQRPLPKATDIVSPQEHHFSRLHSVLSKEVVGHGAEVSWLKLFYLYRNKLAHLGSFMFPQISFHDRSGNFYAFIPNQWPCILEQHMKPAGTQAGESSHSVQQFAEKFLVHQDIVEYSEGLVKRVRHLLDQGFGLLCDTYKEFRDFDPHPKVLKSLQKKSKSYAFRYFED